MEAIKQQLSELQTVWAEVYPAMRANPTAWQPHLPNVFAEQIDEVISTIATWIEKITAPEGFKPSFHLAKGVISTSMPQLLVTAKNLQKGEYNYLLSFIGGLNQILSALHSMVVFSSKTEGKHLAADLAGQLSETLSLLGTAQRELRAKTDTLKKVSDIAKDTESRATVIKELEVNVTTLTENAAKVFDKLVTDTQNQSTKVLAELQAKTTESLSQSEAKFTKLNTSTETSADAVIRNLKDQTSKTIEKIESLQVSAAEKLSKISADVENSAKLKKEIEELLKTNVSLSEALTKQSSQLEELQKTSQTQQVLIKELLPDAASAGLAAGFEARASELNSTKLLWIFLFITSIIGLVTVTWTLSTEITANKDPQVWFALLQRLPFVAPFIWLGWFSAIQYGNTIRVQEDYAFKAATSKAFAGFRDHMEHLASINLSEGNNAMKFLAAKTIETLSHEPLRIFQKTDKDASPAGGFLAMFDRGGQKAHDEKSPK